MCNDHDDDDFDFPGSEVGGYNILYPGDPIRQAEAMFSGENESSRETDSGATAEYRARPTVSILPRLLLFLLCLAFPPIWPVVWLLRPKHPR